MENVTLTQEVISNFKKFRANFQAANDMYEKLREHTGKYVSIADGKVLGYTDSYEEAIKEYGSISGIYIELISKDNIFWIL
jgi:hypothetical protein